jgi:hypothetical protein
MGMWIRSNSRVNCNAQSSTFGSFWWGGVNEIGMCLGVAVEKVLASCGRAMFRCKWVAVGVDTALWKALHDALKIWLKEERH